MDVERRKGQHVVYDTDLQAVKHARTIGQMPKPQKWLANRIEKMLTTSWTSHIAEAPGVIQHTPTADTDTAPKNLIVARFYIGQDDITSHGCTQNCPKCQHIIAY